MRTEWNNVSRHIRKSLSDKMCR